MPLDRRDFVPPGTSCNACHKPLEKAYIEILNGTEFYYGPDCAKAKFSSLSNCPNLTSAYYLASVAANTGGAGGSGGGTTSNDAKAYAYLLLRFDSLTKLDPVLGKNVYFSGLFKYFNAYRASGSLTAPEIANVLAIEANAPKKLKLKNLSDVYIAMRHIDELINSSQNNFAKGARTSLINNLTLSPNLAKRLKVPVKSSAFK